MLLGIPLAGPNGTYALDRFSAVRVEFRSGPIGPGIQGGPNELISLVGKPGTRAIVLARTDDRAGRALGWEFGALLGLPVETPTCRAGFPSFIALHQDASESGMARLLALARAVGSTRAGGHPQCPRTTRRRWTSSPNRRSDRPSAASS